MDNNYIWSEIQKKSDSDIFFVQEHKYPALIGEITGLDINDNIRVNLRPRFAYLLDSTKKTNAFDDTSTAMHEWELDLFLHLAAHLDMLSGFNKNNNQIDIVRYEIENKLYGEEIYRLFNDIEYKDQDILLRNFCNKSNSLLVSLKNAFKELFHNGLIYRSNDEIYVYVDKNQNEEDDTKFKLLNKLFVPIHMRLNIHYKYHMGVIGIKETMKIDKIRIV